MIFYIYLNNMNLFHLFDYLQILFWIITYILIILFDIKYKISLISLTAICFNFSWELIQSINSFSSIAVFVGILIWLCLDFFILLLHFYYGGIILSKTNRLKFYFISIVFLLFFLIFNFVLNYYFNDYFLYSSFLANSIMSLLFLYIILKTKEKYAKPQFYIAFFRFVGTLCATIAYGILNNNIIIFVIGMIIGMIDICSIFYSFKYIKK